ncbi:MAG: PH domain-containing protein [Alphaproteobacteria bacterium]|nr:PH domain-containing protein [Alphaproteobacteria bacterium]
MQYVDKSLAADETILVRGRWPMAYWVGAWVQLLVLGIVIIGIVLFIAAVIRMKTTEFAVTNRRVILKRGWLTRTTEELAVESIEAVHLDQSIWGRLFRYGRLVVTGTGDARVHFPPMAEPITFRRAIEEARARAGEMKLGAEEKEALVAVAEAAKEATVQTAKPATPQKRRSGFVGLLGR